MIISPGTTSLSTIGRRGQNGRAPSSWRTTTPPTTTLRPQQPSDHQSRERRRPPWTAFGPEFPPPTITAGRPTPPPTRTAATGWRPRRSRWRSPEWRRPCPPWPELPLRSGTASPYSRRTWHNWRLPPPRAWKAVWLNEIICWLSWGKKKCWPALKTFSVIYLWKTKFGTARICLLLVLPQKKEHFHLNFGFQSAQLPNVDCPRGARAFAKPNQIH